MLLIQTDIENSNWLHYILEEFCRIERANFNFKIITESTNDKNVLRYDSTDKTDVYSSARNFSKHIEWIDDEIFIIKGTQKKDSRAFFKYDLIWNAFVFLSRKIEWDQEEQGNLIQSYSKKTGIADERVWDIPIVNVYFQSLKNYIQRTFPELSFKPPFKPKIELSHDLDYIKKTVPLRFKQSLFRSYNGIKYLKPKQIWSGLSFLMTQADYWNFSYWQELEKSYDMNSVFYVYCKTNKPGVKEWLMDPSYDIVSNKKLQGALKNLINSGWKLGLHGSFNSARDFDLLQSEKENLESVLNIEIKKTRQHWLRFTEKETPQSHEKLFEEDSTIGWNNRIGFRAGSASKFRPYNHQEDRAFNYFVIPQIIMDSNIFDYGFNKELEIIQQCKAMIIRCSQIENAHFSISWHPRTCHKEYKWQEAYSELLNTWKTSI